MNKSVLQSYTNPTSTFLHRTIKLDEPLNGSKELTEAAILASLGLSGDAKTLYHVALQQYQQLTGQWGTAQSGSLEYQHTAWVFMQYSYSESQQ